MLFCVSDPRCVSHTLDLNGRAKIKLIGNGVDEPAFYAKWTRAEIEMFIMDNYYINDRAVFDRLVEFGTLGGTPEVVSVIMESGEAKVYNPQNDIMAAQWNECLQTVAEIINTIQMLSH